MKTKFPRGLLTTCVVTIGMISPFGDMGALQTFAVTTVQAQNAVTAATGESIYSLRLPEGTNSSIILPEKIPLEELEKQMPEYLIAKTRSGKVIQIPVHWVSTEDYETSNLYYLEFDPVFDAGDIDYSIDPDSELPYIGVVLESLTGYSSKDFSESTSGRELSEDSSEDVPAASLHAAMSAQKSMAYGYSMAENQSLAANSNASSEAAEITQEDADAAETETYQTYMSVQSAEDNEAAVYQFLRNEMNLNTAGAVGILTNIQAESNFNPTAAGDIENGEATSYGICQWHGSRRDSMLSWCSANGYDSSSLEGQLRYLQYEAENNFPNTLGMVRDVADTADGAYEAAYDWCRYYERPANVESTSSSRGRRARDTYFPKYYEGPSEETDPDSPRVDFTDVTDPDSQWFYDAVYWAKDQGITAGVGDGTRFGVGQPCTREQVVTFLYNEAGRPEVEDYDKVAAFQDVHAEDWFYTAVAWAVNQGITAGEGDGTLFGVGHTCTREQAMTFLWNSTGKQKADADTELFSDVPEGTWFTEAVRWGISAKVTSGIGNGKFGTGQDCTREEIVMFLYNLYS